MPTDRITLMTLMPEILLVLLAVVIFIGGTVTRSKLLWSTIAVFTFAVVAVLVWRQAPGLVAGGEMTEAIGMRLSGPLLLDPLAQGLR